IWSISFFSRNILTNRILLGSIALSIFTVLFGIYGPVISDFLALNGPDRTDWFYVLGAAASYLAVFETIKFGKRLRNKQTT
ncbi:MAG: Calcium-translocating P-type ATPase, PMCA-type, partial [Synergistales bacterium 58_81]